MVVERAEFSMEIYQVYGRPIRLGHFEISFGVCSKGQCLCRVRE